MSDNNEINASSTIQEASRLIKMAEGLPQGLRDITHLTIATGILSTACNALHHSLDVDPVQVVYALRELAEGGESRLRELGMWPEDSAQKKAAAYN